MDISVRYHHLFVLGSLAYGFDGEPDMINSWDRVSALPPQADILQKQISDKKTLVEFVEGDLELVPEFREFSLEQRILSKSYPGLELVNTLYKSYNVGSVCISPILLNNLEPKLILKRMRCI